MYTAKPDGFLGSVLHLHIAILTWITAPNTTTIFLSRTKECKVNIDRPLGLKYQNVSCRASSTFVSEFMCLPLGHS